MNPVVTFVAFVFGSRLFALFAFYPIAAALYASFDPRLKHLPLLLGCYSFFQCFFQLVWASLSQYYGRIKIVRLGLLLFLLSSLLAYTATDSTVLLLARSLQGASAIGATTQALLADYITDLRALQTAYYQIGIGIVLSFMLSFLIGPLFNPPALFFVATACCAGAGLILSYFLPPQPGLTAQQKSLVPAELPSVALVATMSVNAGLHFLQSLVIGSYQLVAQPGLYELSALFVLALVICLYPLKKRELSLSFYVAQFVALFFLCLVGYNLISYSEYQPLSFRVFCGMTFVLLLLLEASLPAQLRLTAAQDYPFWIGIYTTLQSLSIGLGALCLYYAAYCWALMATMAIVLMILLGSLFMMTRMTPPHIAHAHSLQ